MRTKMKMTETVSRFDSRYCTRNGRSTTETTIRGTI